MNDRVQTIGQTAGYGYEISAQQRNKVLRNTYWLLALSMLPTVLGAWVGVSGVKSQEDARVAIAGITALGL